MSDVVVDRKTWVRAEVISVAAIASLLLVLCLAMPIVAPNVASNQYLIGPMVNAALIYSGLRFKKLYNVIGIVLVPSVCVAILGALGINAIFMMYMIPFIWLGNMAIVLSFRFLSRRRYHTKAIIGVGLKVAIIFCGFLVLQSLGAFPTPVAERLYTMMGVVQLITATCGAVIAYGAIKVTKVSKASY